MIRRISLIILFASSTLVLAEPLYKWVEADGTITFSPTKPPAGTSFKTISQAANLPSPDNTDLENVSQSSVERPITNATTAEPEQKRDTPITNVAPLLKNEKTMPSGNASIIRSSQSQPPVNAQFTGSKPAPLTPAQIYAQSVAESAASNKQRRCQDLRKRVVSLERRLKSRLTPEDMDNTIVHMARYQRSFDQHCVQ